MNIGIVIPVFEQSEHLYRCLHSVIGQVHRNDEIIVVNDNNENESTFGGEADRTKAIIDDFNSTYHNTTNQGIATIRSGINQGVSAARNSAVPLFSAGIDWLKFLDADDVLAPFALNSFRTCKVPDDIHVVSGSLIQVVDGIVGQVLKPSFERILFSNPTLVSNSFVRRSAFAKVGGFDTRIQFEEDWDLWLKIEKEFGINAFGVMDFPACYYWICAAERQAKKRDHSIAVMDAAKAKETKEGEPFPMKRIDVREYFRQKYKIKS